MECLLMLDLETIPTMLGFSTGASTCVKFSQFLIYTLSFYALPEVLLLLGLKSLIVLYWVTSVDSAHREMERHRKDPPLPVCTVFQLMMGLHSGSRVCFRWVCVDSQALQTSFITTPFEIPTLHQLAIRPRGLHIN